jgi:hypothetical protein
MVDHRVRPAAGKDVVAEVDERVLLRLPGIRQLLRRIDRRVGPGVAEQGGGFVAEGAAAVEAADESLALPEAYSRNGFVKRFLFFL